MYCGLKTDDVVLCDICLHFLECENNDAKPPMPKHGRGLKEVGRIQERRYNERHRRRSPQQSRRSPS